MIMPTPRDGNKPAPRWRWRKGTSTSAVEFDFVSLFVLTSMQHRFIFVSSIEARRRTQQVDDETSTSQGNASTAAKPTTATAARWTFDLFLFFFSRRRSNFPKDKECGVDDNDYLQVIPVELSNDRDDKKEVIFFLICSILFFFAPALTIDTPPTSSDLTARF